MQTQAEATKILASVTTGLHVDPSTETVATFVERWLRDWAEISVSNATYARYAGLLRNNVVPVIGTIPIQKLQPAHLQQVYASMARAGLSDRTRLHAHRAIGRMLTHATQWHVVSRNVAELVDTPRVKPREVAILTSTEVQAVLEALRGKPLYMIALVLLTTGLRRGEALALRWQDVDLDAGVLRVEQAFEQTKRGGLRLKEPKTRYGRRTVTLPPSTVSELRAHKKAQQELRLACGLGGRATLVFDHFDGSPLSPDVITHQWHAAMKAAGLKATLHSLRHTHASTLLASGLDVLTISRRLGHATPVLVLTTYGHLFKPDDRAAAIMEAALDEHGPERICAWRAEGCRPWHSRCTAGTRGRRPHSAEARCTPVPTRYRRFASRSINRDEV
ncbi:MAG TPA: site-specific integrase [Hyphomicrobiaceae bacterium]|nr:site-specific integrase [Hyphomicrobiaceae bacterium]